MGFLSKILSAKGGSASGGKRKENQAVKKSEEREAALKVPVRAEPQFKTENKSGRIYGVIRAPLITEKTASLGKNRAYTFVVAPSANKIDIKRAVESRFSVKVEKVNILNMPDKERRRGRQIGWKAGFKKAAVKLKEGQTIEIQ